MGSAQQTQTVIVGSEDSQPVLSHAAPIPIITDDLVLIQNKAIAVNPVDTKTLGPYITAGAIPAGDFAGFVEQAGLGAAKYSIKVGDQDCGAMLGMSPLEPTLGALPSMSARMRLVSSGSPTASTTRRRQA